LITGCARHRLMTELLKATADLMTVAHPWAFARFCW
jgi:hypothetical protein